MFLYNYSVKIAKIQHVFVKYDRIVFTKAPLCLQINGVKVLKNLYLFFS